MSAQIFSPTSNHTRIHPGNTGPIATFKHLGLDCDFVLAQEYMGTRRFIEIFPLLQYVLDNGGLAVIDELDTDIHPLLMPELLRWFYDTERNPHGAQLLFTAHNPAILDHLEKEQVFFSEKPSGKPTRIYGAREIKGLRSEPSLMKKIPFRRARRCAAYRLTSCVRSLDCSPAFETFR